MSGLVFSEENLIRGNVFKFEERLHSPLNKYVENGAILTTYFSQDENISTVDRGTGDIDKLFGKHSPFRWHKINNVPLYGFGQANPENTEENNIEDISIEGECQIIPDTVAPKQYDLFIINHLQMVHLFVVTAVHYDSMKPDGYYKINYRLWSTAQETIDKVEAQCLDTSYMDLRAIGTSTNPVVKEEDYLYRTRVEKMVDAMIDAYRGLYYNDRHNCFLYTNPSDGLRWFDLCGNEFMARYSIINHQDSTKVIVLHDKIQDNQMAVYNNNSVYNWLELGAPERLLQRFYFILHDASAYPLSSFELWGDGDVQIMQPISIRHAKINNQQYSFFDTDQLNAFLDKTKEPESSEYDKLIWRYIHKGNDIGVKDVSLYTGDALLNSIRHMDTFLYTPMIIYIIRQILGRP